MCYSNQWNASTKILNIVLALVNSKIQNFIFGKFWSKIKLEVEIQNFDTGVCRGVMLIWIENSELASFKTLGRVRSGSLKMILWRESLSKFCMQCRRAKIYTIRYDVIRLQCAYLQYAYLHTYITTYAYNTLTAKISKFFVNYPSVSQFGMLILYANSNFFAPTKFVILALKQKKIEIFESFWETPKSISSYSFEARELGFDI